MTTRTQALQDEYLRREGDKPANFRYLFPDGTELGDETELARIAKLAVPPGYTEVYVSPDAEAELQAFGRDAAGRLQYRYHADFTRGHAEAKWKRLVRFAGQLSELRRLTGADLRRSGLPMRKVMALMTRLLYVAHFRVGSDEYARAHKTYGLSTLKKRHVSVHGSTVEFDFKGKHSIAQHKATTDRTLAGNVEKLLELPGPRTAWLFRAEEGDGLRRVRAGDLNAYIKEVMGPFTAKDFRTWGGTLAAAEFLAQEGVAESERAAKKALIECVKFVAEDLGNTPAVVRAHYISPYVFDAYLGGRVLDDFEPRGSRRHSHGEEGLTGPELALKRMLAASGRSGKKEAAEATPA